MEKIKQFVESEKGRNILMVAIVILVGFGSFELGRLSKGNEGSGVRVEYPNSMQTENSDNLEDQSANALSAVESVKSTSSVSPATQKSNASTKNFFASSRGKKYYPVGCSAGKSLKMENRIYFATREEAVKAGYELSSSCR
jgi:hypothetical protein